LINEFTKVDTEGTGLISLKELEVLVTKLNPDFTADDFKSIAAKLTAVEGDKVRFKDFVALFAGEKNKNISPSLAKPLSAGEKEALTETFNKYDKDKSSQIDLTELKGMCESLGKKLSDEQAAQAMAQLDKDGNMKCNFEEFCLWYQCTPQLGGYNHVALSFMKAQLAMKSGIRKITKRAKKSIDNTDEFTFAGSLDLSPTPNASAEACSATLAMKKAEGATNAAPRLSIQLSAKDPDVAAASLRSWRP